MKKINYLIILLLCAFSFMAVGKRNEQYIIMRNDTSCHKTTDGKFVRDRTRTSWISSYTSTSGEAISRLTPGNEGMIAILSGSYALLDEGGKGVKCTVFYTSNDRYIITNDAIKVGGDPFLLMRWDPCIMTLRH